MSVSLFLNGLRCCHFLHKIKLLVLACAVPISAWAVPNGFVELTRHVPGIVVDLRYAGSENFVGEPIEGYLPAQTAVLTVSAAAALAQVQADLAPFGLGLKVFDAYRPQRAVNHFIRWAQDPSDERKKTEYYPEVNKRDLFKLEYIASHSGHSRGSTVDLTVVSLSDGQELDMGSRFDFFGEQSWPTFQGLTAQQRANRLLLRQAMTRRGFIPYKKEWWHFTLRDEPYPKTYFDFVLDDKQP